MNLFKKLRQTAFGASVLMGATITSFADGGLCASGNFASNCSVDALEKRMKTNFTSMADLFYLGAGISGVAMIVIGLLKLKAHSMDSQGTSGHLRTAIWLLIIGALMLSIPVIMMLGSTSITGNSVQMTPESGVFPTS
jgi:hypothetical protein